MPSNPLPPMSATDWPDAVDGWNASLSAADVNSSTFGVAINDNVTAAGMDYIDHVRITVNHAAAADSSLQTRKSPAWRRHLSIPPCPRSS